MDFLTFAMDDDVTERKKREKKAASAECTPLSIDLDLKRGQFKGSSGYYKTTLDGCSCIDFSRRRHPCKHMYRLAAELGVYKLGELQNDVSKVKMMKYEKDSLEGHYTAIVDSYPEDVQRDLQEALYRWHNNESYVSTQSLVRLPVSDNLLVVVDDPVLILKSKTQKETVDGLLSAGFPFPEDLKTTKKARYEWCLSHPSAPCHIVFPDDVVVKVSDSLEPVALRVYKYLNKKYGRRDQFFLL